MVSSDILQTTNKKRDINYLLTLIGSYSQIEPLTVLWPKPIESKIFLLAEFDVVFTNKNPSPESLELEENSWAIRAIIFSYNP